MSRSVYRSPRTPIGRPRVNSGPGFLYNPIVQDVAARAARQAYFMATRVVDSTPQRGGGGVPPNVRLPFQYPGPPGRGGRGNVTGTPGGSIMISRRLGAVSSKSAGFLKTKQRPKKSKRNQFRVKGAITHVIEVNGVTQGTDCVTVGHHTRPNLQIRVYMWAAVMKLLHEKAGFVINSMSSTVGLSTGDVYVIEFQNTIDSGGTSLGYTVGAGDTYQTVINWLSDVVRAWNAPGTDSTCVLLSISRRPVNLVSSFNNPGYVYMRLQDVRIQFDVKSSMKMQNRTINSAGNDTTEDVDNVPLYGRGFMFKGDHLMPAAGSLNTATIFANQQHGYIVDVASNRANEPNMPSSYKGVKKFGKVHLDPGQIKTSVLYDRFSHDFCAAYKLYNTNQASSQKNVGVSRVFQVEKMINTANTFQIQLAWEVNQAISVRAIERKSRPTVQSLEKIFIAPLTP